MKPLSVRKITVLSGLFMLFCLLLSACGAGTAPTTKEVTETAEERLLKDGAYAAYNEDGTHEAYFLVKGISFTKYLPDGRIDSFTLRYDAEKETYLLTESHVRFTVREKGSRLLMEVEDGPRYELEKINRTEIPEGPAA